MAAGIGGLATVTRVADDAVTLTLDGRDVRITSPDKVFFSRRGETKLDLVEYYVAVAEPLLRTMGDRPVLLQRFPDGASGKSFFQKRVPQGAPEWLHTTVVSTPNGTTSNALVAADIAHVAWAVNLGCLGFHVWPYHWDDPNHTDELRIDLDPQPGVVFDQIREAAYAVKALCDELGVAIHVKTSGSKGMHLYMRLALRWNSFDVRAAAIAMARELERRHPALVTAAWWKEERGARVFIDFNQNAPHKTVFGAWSVRPRVGGQISMPVSWDDVATVQPEELTIATGPAALAERGDAWATINEHPQSLEPLLGLVAADVQRGLMDAPWPPVYPKQPNEPPRVAPSRAKKD
jgi:DNA ligase D